MDKNVYIILLLIIIVILVVYIKTPKKMKLIATSEAVVAECGMTKFHFDPPLSGEANTYMVTRWSADGDIVSLEVFATKEP
jgi:hypothetical protein